MYTELLKGISQRNGLVDDRSCATHLRGLQPYARGLWQSYRTQDVVVDYADTRTQESYLLRYFPNYSIPVAFEMNDLLQYGIRLPDVELIEGVFFGCGPGPEIIGLMQHLVNADAAATMLSARLVDVASDTWAYSRDIVLRYIAEPEWEPRLVEFVSTQACLSDREALINSGIDGCHFAVVQNCLNEIHPNSRGCVVENLMHQIGRMAPGAIAVVIDRDGYEATVDMMRYMHELASASDNINTIGEIEPVRRSLSTVRLINDAPRIVTDNLLHRWGENAPDDWSIDGLILAKSIDYITMTFQVSAAAA